MTERERACAQCLRVFVLSTKAPRQQYCSVPCRNTAMAARHAAKAKNGPNWKTCAWCERRFRPSTPERRCCSRECMSRRRVSMRAERQLSPNKSLERLGDVLVQPSAPFCPNHPGQALAFGSDPMTGRGLEYCPKCGERPMPMHGVRTYTQGGEREAEAEGFVERSKRPPKPGKGALRSWKKNFKVIGSLMARRMEVA